MSTVEARDAPFVLVDPVDAFAAFCSLLVTDRGTPFVLEDWQRGIARSILVDRIVETVVLIPKGNGKTTLLSAIALWHLLTTAEARCYIGAASAQQAGEMFRHAWGFVRRDAARGGELSELVDVQPGYKRIVRPDDGGIIEVRAADAATQDGVGPTLALVDEYHRHPTDGLYSVFRDGLDKRDGQLVVISTAGDDEDTPLGRLRANLLDHVVTTDGRYVYCHDREGGAALHQWALRPDDDPNDLQLVKAANPLGTITIAKLKRRRMSPSMTLGKWMRLTCNLWSTGDEAAVSKPEWDACHDPNATIPDGADIILGVDLAWKWDTLAMVPIWWDDENDRWVVGRVIIMVPPRDGTSIDADRVKGAMRWYADRYRVTLVVDPNHGGQQLAQELEADLAADGTGNGIVDEAVEYSQSAGAMATAAMRLVEAVRTGGLAWGGADGHDGDGETLTRQVLRAAAAPLSGDDEEMFRLEKPRSGGVARRRRGEERNYRCIDAAIGLAMALAVGTAVEEDPDYDYIAA